MLYLNPPARIGNAAAVKMKNTEYPPVSERSPGDMRFIRNLKDSGCNAETIQKFLLLGREGKRSLQLQLLSRQRRSLLKKLHESQNKIDSLDFLIFSMKPDNQPKTRL